MIDTVFFFFFHWNLHSIAFFCFFSPLFGKIATENVWNVFVGTQKDCWHHMIWYDMMWFLFVGFCHRFKLCTIIKIEMLFRVPCCVRNMLHMVCAKLHNSVYYNKNRQICLFASTNAFVSTLLWKICVDSGSLIFIEFSFIRQINASTQSTSRFVFGTKWCRDINVTVVAFVRNWAFHSNRPMRQKDEKKTESKHLRMASQHAIVNCALNNTYQSESKQENHSVWPRLHAYSRNKHKNEKNQNNCVNSKMKNYKVTQTWIRS